MAAVNLRLATWLVGFPLQEPRRNGHNHSTATDLTGEVPLSKAEKKSKRKERQQEIKEKSDWEKESVRRYCLVQVRSALVV
ncbi:hypothetical protein CEXT_601661 [Caerostris extrusa]|uniref:Uncharacterized protein n=1 Tax=Caerostris extrusa TaxID=172846 RepID=A0AAV4PI30_CAEEX|nr:hypothetical protein CEXT_601661 [Caerostris extrusa]